MEQIVASIRLVFQSLHGWTRRSSGALKSNKLEAGYKHASPRVHYFPLTCAALSSSEKGRVQYTARWTNHNHSHNLQLRLPNRYDHIRSTLEPCRSSMNHLPYHNSGLIRLHQQSKSRCPALRAIQRFSWEENDTGNSISPLSTTNTLAEQRFTTTVDTHTSMMHETLKDTHIFSACNLERPQ